MTATTTPNGTTVYVGQRLVEDYTHYGSSRTHYVFNGQVVAQRSSWEASPIYLHGDHLGSLAVTTNKNGGVLSRQDYDPWGAVRSSSGARQTAFDFTGQRWYFAGDGGRWWRGVATLGDDDRVALRTLTVDFLEPNFVTGLNMEHMFTQMKGFWFQLGNEDRQKAT